MLLACRRTTNHQRKGEAAALHLASDERHLIE
jgi:hypothetical protein